MTKITFAEITEIKKGNKPIGLSKLSVRCFKKFGYCKCPQCKEYFIKHREEHFYCSAQCRTYHFRKRKGQ
jgi:hypothetical protein